MKVFNTLSPSVKMDNVWCLTFKPPTFLHFVVTEFRENFSSSYFTFSIVFFCQFIDWRFPADMWDAGQFDL